ncbi:MAG: quinone oxidoreductase family protein [Acidimicrobiia bacterium]
MEAIQVGEFGGPDVMVWSDLAAREPDSGELLVQVAAAGVNFIDTYHRTGLYPLDLPFTPGIEGAGVVVSVGNDVEGFSQGDRVAWTSRPGAYATTATIPVQDAVRLPEEVSFDDAAALLLQGITAHYLATSTWPLEPGQRCLVHAGAGGVGGLLIQIAKLRGAEVIATAGGPEKVAIATEAGADHVIDYATEDFVAGVERIAGSRPLDVIYDGVGAATVQRGLALLRPRGLMAAFGNASGPVPPIDILDLSRNGALYITRPNTGGYLRTQEERSERIDDLLRWLAEGKLQLRIGARYPMAEAATAHRALEGRQTTGKVLLLPEVPVT